MQADTILTSALTGVLSTVSSIVICYLTLRNKASMSDAQARTNDRVTLRNEMRTEIYSLKEKMEQMRIQMQTEIDGWRDKYNAMFLENGKLRLEFNAIKTQVTFLKDQAPETSTRVFDNVTEHYERPKDSLNSG